MAEARNAKPGGFKYRTFLVVCTTADCISFISSLACNTVKIANHRGSRFQAAEAVVRHLAPSEVSAALVYTKPVTENVWRQALTKETANNSVNYR